MKRAPEQAAAEGRRSGPELRAGSGVRRAHGFACLDTARPRTSTIAASPPAEGDHAIAVTPDNLLFLLDNSGPMRHDAIFERPDVAHARGTGGLQRRHVRRGGAILPGALVRND